MATIDNSAENRPLALVSVYDKTGITEFGGVLAKVGYEIVSTGRTAEALRAAGVPVTPIEDITGNPEMLDGRVKTLGYKTAAGILYQRDNTKHLAEVATHGIRPIDVVVCNLYPFAETIAKPGVTLPEAIEQIDIGGPTLLRSAAKNWRDVLVVPHPRFYDLVSLALIENRVDQALRYMLAYQVFAMTADYDKAIVEYLFTHAPAGPNPLT